MLRLVALGAAEPQIYELHSSRVTIGTGAGNDLLLDEPTASRRHAALARRGRGPRPCARPASPPPRPPAGGGGGAGAAARPPGPPPRRRGGGGARAGALPPLPRTPSGSRGSTTIARWCVCRRCSKTP